MEEAREFRKTWLHVRLTEAERAAIHERARRENRQVSELARAGLVLILAGTDRPSEAVSKGA